MKPFIYGLVDPLEPKHVRYVGMAMRASRPYDHAKEARSPKTESSYKINWIRSVHSEGRDYAVLKLEELAEGTSRSFLGEIEKMYIASLKAIGHHLTNGTSGGDGGDAFRGHKHTDEVKEAIRKRRTGSVTSAATKEKLSIAGMGRVATEETLAKRSKSCSEFYVTHPEVAKERGVLVSESWTPERRQTQSDAMLGNTNGVGHVATQKQRDICAARSLGNTYGLGVVHSEEELVRRSVALKRYNSDPANQAALAERRKRQSETLRATNARKREAENVSR